MEVTDHLHVPAPLLQKSLVQFSADLSSSVQTSYGTHAAFYSMVMVTGCSFSGGKAAEA
jgi:hypothetical protein